VYGVRVLVVEDEYLIAMSLEEMLVKLGTSREQYERSTSAIRFLSPRSQKPCPDVIPLPFEVFGAGFLDVEVINCELDVSVMHTHGHVELLAARGVALDQVGRSANEIFFDPGRTQDPLVVELLSSSTARTSPAALKAH
jgi:CheY-like chemotaxis protein